MDEHLKSRTWLIRVSIVTALWTCALQGSHAAETDALEVPQDASVEETDSSSPASDETVDDADGGLGLTPPAAATDTLSPDGIKTDAEQIAPVEATDTSSPATEKTGDDADSGLGLTAPAAATDASSPTGDKAIDDAMKAQLAWEKFVPPPDSEFDWIQLVSGEWLKGELKTVYDYQMEFDSDELGLLRIDLENVQQVRTARVEAVRFEVPGPGSTPVTVFGVLTVVDNKVTVGTGPDARTIDRSHIISIAKGAERERDLWTGSLSIGANLRSGNTDLTDSTIQGRAERRRAISRYVAEYLGNFSSALGVETSNNHRLTTYFDVFKSSKMYWRTVYLEYVRDKFRNIEHQANINTGIGFDIIRSSKKDWDVTASVGALYKRFVSVELGNDIDNLSPAIGLGTRYDQDVTRWLDFLFDYRLQIVDEDNGSLIHHMLTKVSTEFVADFDFEVSVVWDRVRNPQPAADGREPEQDDFRMIFGIAYEF